METAINRKGFTLVELLIVIAILGIIAAIAFPSYKSYVQKTKRAETQAELTEVASQMQRFKMANYTFVQSVSGTTIIPINLTRLGYAGTAPNSSNGLYQINLQFNQAATEWVLSAVPLAGGAQNNTGVSCINDRGQRYWSKTTATAAACEALITSTSNWDGK